MKTTLALCVLFSLLAGLPVRAADGGEADGAPRDQFFAHLRSLCGARFEGAMTYPADGQDDFAGKTLVATIEACTDDEIRIPFAVGDDRSRTWLVTRTVEGLRLQHDHRHADGTPDEITDYGGTTVDEGTAREQRFPADAYTAALIPAAATNVWTLRSSDDGETLTYHLERHGAPRFTAVLDRVR